MAGQENKQIVFLGMCEDTGRPLIAVAAHAEAKSLKNDFAHGAKLNRGVALTRERLDAAVAHAEAIDDHASLQELKLAKAAVARRHSGPSAQPS